jgi:hypothetical protein
VEDLGPLLLLDEEEVEEEAMPAWLLEDDMVKYNGSPSR